MKEGLERKTQAEAIDPRRNQQLFLICIVIVSPSPNLQGEEEGGLWVLIEGEGGIPSYRLP